MIRKIALRNLTEHRSKSMIVGGLIAIAVMLLVVGNSLMASISDGMRQSFTEQYSGDLFIFAPHENENELSIFGTFGDDAPATLERFDDVESSLSALPNIKQVSKMTVGMGALESPQGEQTASTFWGIDPQVWEQSFGRYLTWYEGGLWQPGDAAIALTRNQAEILSEAQGAPMQVGDQLLLTVIGDNGIRIREMTLSGIFEFQTVSAPQMEIMSLVDLASSQALLSLDHTRAMTVTLAENEASLLGAVDDSDLFGDSGLLGDTDNSLFAQIDSVSMDDVNADLAQSLKRDTSTQPHTVPQYQFAVVLLEDPSQLTQTQVDLENWAIANDLDWRIGDWTNAAGFIGNMVNSIKLVLNGFVMIIAFVATLIIMNTLVISVTERLQEIGTMRAIGAQKMFIRKVILAETLWLALASSAFGVIVAAIALALANMTGLPAANEIMQVLFGGDVLYPTLSYAAVVQAVVLMTSASLIACLYPLGIALKVSPLKAMQG